MKLKVNGKLASFNGYLKGTIYIDGSPYDWDNTDSPGPTPEWQLLSKYSFNEIEDPVGWFESLATGNPTAAHQFTRRGNSIQEVSYNSDEEALVLSWGLTSSGTPEPGNTGRFGYMHAADFKPTGKCKYKYVTNIYVEDLYNPDTMALKDKLQSIQMFHNTGQTGGGWSGDYTRLLFGRNTSPGVSGLEWNYREYRATSGTPSTSPSEFKIGDYFNKWIKLEMEYEFLNNGEVYDIMYKINDQYIGRVYPQLILTTDSPLYLNVASSSWNSKWTDPDLFPNGNYVGHLKLHIKDSAWYKLEEEE